MKPTSTAPDGTETPPVAVRHTKDWPRCGVVKRLSGKPCRNAAGKGTDHVGIGQCWLHLGNAPGQKKAAQKVLATRALRRLGVPIPDADPADQLLQMVREAAGNVAFLRDLVATLLDPPELARVRAGLVDGTLVDDPEARVLYAEMLHVSGVLTGEAKPHVLVAMYDAERDRLVRYSSEAMRAGLEERLVRVRESQMRTWGDQLDGALSAVLDPAQAEAVRREFGARMRQFVAVPIVPVVTELTEGESL